MNRRDNSRSIRARTGPGIVARSCLTEATVRILQNNIDPGVDEAPEALIAYGGIGRAVRAAIRGRVPHLGADRYLADELAWAKEAVLAGALSNEVKARLFQQ